MKVSEIAHWLGLPSEGDAALDILQAAPLDTAGPADISFVLPRKARREAVASRAGCLIVPEDFDNAPDVTNARTIIRAPDPRAAIARVVSLLHPPARPEPGIHPTALVAATAVIGQDVSIGPFAVVSEAASIGDRTAIGAHCSIGAGARIGADSTLHARVTLYPNTVVGARCILHSGIVLGADGFGFNRTPRGYEKFPQIGRVILGDDVELGANCTVDRAALGATAIGDGTKFDDMVHIGHNCRIGRHVLIVAQTGVGGGSVIEDWCVIGGQVGIGDNVRIKSGAILGSKSGVLPGKILPGGGQTYWGVPA
ncbi:MAG: UDP-3-O-(3-hydroxymyristoyl)glucosamine N-acyltransferase, partial [Bryobacteraceae bacterium]